MMPVPTHLVGIAVPCEAMLDDTELQAELRCGCGSRSFELLFPGQTHICAGREIPCTAEIDGRFFFVVSARCSACRLERVLLDVDFHGWDGFICHDPAQAALPRPALIAWHCRTCEGIAHGGTLYISGEGKDDFVRAAGCEFEADRWPDAFGWFTLSSSCDQCGKVTPELISCETM